MNKSVQITIKWVSCIIFMLFTMIIPGQKDLFAQGKQSITGKLLEANTGKPVSFGTIALLKAADSAIAGGAMSDENGVFSLGPVRPGSYILKVSNIGYKPVSKSIEVKEEVVTDAGIMYLHDTAVMLKELVIEGERVKAKSENDRTAYLMTKKMTDASNTGIDVLRLIPGVQVDLMQNISLEGSRSILIYVDGKERDKSYLGQLDPKLIDRIEIISAPPSGYDGNVTGAINVVLRKDRNSGVNGKILAEIPTSSVVYIFPSYSINYSIKRLNLYTSYNGEMTCLNLHESLYQKEWKGQEANEITSEQFLRQKDWSHRFHYGFDYFLSEKDQIDFYAFYNPFSRELDGDAESHLTGHENSDWHAKREDTDVNTSSFYSLYYKHAFDKKGQELSVDLSDYNLKANNRTDYISDDYANGTVTGSNIAKPEQNVINIKLDYTAPLTDKLNFSTGIKTKFQKMKDAWNNFAYTENIYATYASLSLKQKSYDLSAGLRAERSSAELKENSVEPVFSLLPYTSFRLKLNTKQNILFSLNKTVTRPGMYQLNPFVSISDPYNVRKGNPFLRPELRTSIYIEHSVQFKGNYFSTRLFFNRSTDVINNLMFINDTSAFETQPQNSGTIDQTGMQLSGALKFSILTLNPYVKTYGLFTSGNDLAGQYNIPDRKSLVFESGLSAIVSFRHEFTFSASCQYSSPKNNIQGNSFSDMLYLFSLEKGFKNRIKVGIVSVIPFNRSFTYQGSEINGEDFQSHYTGNVQMSSVPVWFRLSYQFSSGKSRDKVARTSEDADNLPKKGF